MRTQAWPGQGRWLASPAGRAVRLTVAAGAAAAGLCLVLGLVALVATIGYPGAVHSGAARAGSRPGHFEQTTLTVGATVATFSGAGLTHQARRTINVPDTWGIAWTFHCQPGRNPGFTVADGTPGTVRITDSANHGHGVWWDFHAPGNHQLLFLSDCAWHAIIVLPGKAGQPGPNPRGQHSGEHGNRHGQGSKHRHHRGHGTGAGHGKKARHGRGSDPGNGRGRHPGRGTGRKHTNEVPVGPLTPRA